MITPKDLDVLYISVDVKTGIWVLTGNVPVHPI